MANGDDSLVHWIQGVGLTALSVIGTVLFGMAKWNWDKLNLQVEGKAEKEEVDQLRNEVDKKANRQEMTDTLTALRDDFERWQQRSDNWRQEQDTKHAENRQRLDAILMGLTKLRR